MALHLIWAELGSLSPLPHSHAKKKGTRDGADHLPWEKPQSLHRRIKIHFCTEILIHRHLDDLLSVDVMDLINDS